jgi:hypothetical protein
VAIDPAELVGAENAVRSCDLHILVYQAAESISSQRSECCSGRWGSGACGRLLMQRPVRAMSVVVLDVLLQHDRQVAWSGDQHVVQAFAAQRADEALGDRVRARCPDWGVTSRSWRSWVGSSLANAVMNARSIHVSVGR